MMMGALAVHADDYTYLTFETADGAKVSVEASSLTITISGTTLTAGSQSFTLSDLSRMVFSLSDESTTITKADNGLTFSSTTATAKMGETFTAPTLTNPYNLSLTWTSSDESVATVDQSGDVTLVAAGTTVITATFAGSDDYEAGSITYTLTVETSVVDAIQSVNADSSVRIFTPSGKLIGTYSTLQAARASLRPGIYIVSNNSNIYKISIKLLCLQSETPNSR